MTDWGYGRVSTKKAKGRKAQHVDNQVDRLVSEGIGRDHILVDDGVSGRKASRPQWDKLLTLVKPGDTVTAVSMTRIGRSTQELLKLMTEFEGRGINVRFLDRDIDTSTANGRLFFHIMAALAEYEADLTRERVTDGLEAARERHGGKLPTRGPSFSPEQGKDAEELLRTTTFSSGKIAKSIGVSRATLYRHMGDDIAAIRGEN